MPKSRLVCPHRRWQSGCVFTSAAGCPGAPEAERGQQGRHGAERGASGGAGNPEQLARRSDSEIPVAPKYHLELERERKRVSEIYVYNIPVYISNKGPPAVDSLAHSHETHTHTHTHLPYVRTLLSLLSLNLFFDVFDRQPT
jgi:hypothetical protein